jgi:hypothetical protein
MENKKYIEITKLCEYYQIPEGFFVELQEVGLLEPPIYDKQSQAIDEDYLSELEKIMRLHFDLEINMQGIGTVLQLLNRIRELEEELSLLKKQLKIYQ